MRMQVPLFSILLTVIAATTLAGPTGAQMRSPVVIAVVKDGPSPRDARIEAIEAELGRLVDAATEVRFETGPEYDGQWDAVGVRQALLRALQDRQVDIVVGFGLMVTAAATDPEVKLTKPFVSAFAERADIFDMPYSVETGSLKENFNLIVVPQRVERDIEAFQDMIDFRRLHVAVGGEEMAWVRDRDVGLERFEDSLGVEIELVAVDPADIAGSVDRIGANAEAVLLAMLPRLGADERQRLIAALNQRKLPTFSIPGYSDVELGALAAVAPDMTQQIVRRVALNLNQLIRGSSVADLPVTMNVETRLLINARTALEIGYRPDATTRVFASYLHAEAIEDDAAPLTFAETLEKAEAGNLRLSVSDAGMEARLNEKQITRSLLLPQIGANGSYNDIKGRSDTWEEFLPEQATLVGVKVRQMIYDDRAISNYRSSGRRYEASRFNRERVRLDALAQGGDAYLLLVLSRVIARIEAQNVRLTEDNLDLAKLRVDVGYSGRDEVFRWEAQLARNRSSLIDADAQIDQRRIALNQVLGIDQDLRWAPEEIEVDPDTFYFLDGRIDRVYDDTAKWAMFREFAVQYAMTHSPEIGLLEKASEAQGIQVGQRKRRWYLPVFALDFAWRYEIDRNPALAEGIDKDSYWLGISATYPVFNGGERLYSVRREQAALRGIDHELQNQRNIVERRTRTSLRRVESSFPIIEFQRIAAENSRRNLRLVQDKYAQGLVNVTVLLDAQNSSFTAEQNAAAAVYAFLMDLVEFQRSIAFFEDEKTTQQKDELVTEIEEAVNGL